MTGPNADAFAELMSLQPMNLTSLPIKIQSTEGKAKLDSALAKDTAKDQLVKALAISYEYHTRSRINEKVLQPRKRDIEIIRFQPVKVPALVGFYRFRDRNYTRVCLASTGKLIRDDMATCTFCTNKASVMCENCGALVCEYSHSSKTCMQCSKIICTQQCTISKGIISKKYYCAEHVPKA